MRSLHLYPSTRSFFENQLRALELAGVETQAVPVPGEFEPGTYRSVTEYLKYLPTVLSHSLDGYDVVHANWGLLGPFALTQPSRPVVLTLWGSDVMSDRRWLTHVSRASARFADATVLPSEAMRPPMSDIEGQTLIPFGIDLEQFRPIDRAQARDRVGWDPSERIVLFPYDPSRPEKQYNLAKRIVSKTTVEADLRVVTGADYEEMPYYLNASDAVLVTSARESGPMIIKEAAACNVPVVSTDVGFVRSTIEDVSNSCVCTSNGELIDGLDHVLRGTRRSDGRETLDGLGLERMGTRLAALYERVLDERGD